MSFDYVQDDAELQTSYWDDNVSASTMDAERRCLLAQAQHHKPYHLLATHDHHVDHHEVLQQAQLTDDRAAGDVVATDVIKSRDGVDDDVTPSENDQQVGAETDVAIGER